MELWRLVVLGCLPALLVMGCANEADRSSEADPSASMDQPVAVPSGADEAIQSAPSEGAAPGAVSGSAVLPGSQGAETEVPTTPQGQTQPPVAASCPSNALLSSLGRGGRLLVGAMMTDDVANGTNWDMRYMYLAGGLFPGDAPCGSCGSCNAEWWGCWQDPAVAPGQYVRDFISKTSARSQLPLITYYEFLGVSGLSEGSGQVSAVNEASKMRRYFNDWRFLLQTVGQARVLLHIEPDLWGYAQQVNSNPSSIPAAVRAANPTDCGAVEDSFAGFGKCLVLMARKYAPNAKVGLHASSWASGTDAMQNRSASVDVEGIARGTADFLLAAGGQEADFVVTEVSDRDAGWYELQGQQRWFDATNQQLPSYAQAFRWAKALTTRMNKPGLWWQVPVGNVALGNTHQRYKDNRVDYFLGHMNEVAATGAFGVLFGAGLDHQTNPSTDDGNLINKARSYLGGAGQSACP